MNVKNITQTINISDESINKYMKSNLNKISNEDHSRIQHQGIISIEQMAFSFKLKNKTLFNETTETCEIFYKLVGLSVIEGLIPIELFNKSVTISNVMETKQTDSWCANADDEKLYFTNSSEFRIFTSNSTQYFVYVSDNQRFYSTGLFFLSILYTPKNHFYGNLKSNFNQEEDIGKKFSDFGQYNLTDVTSFMLMSGNNSNIETTFFMVSLNYIFKENRKNFSHSPKFLTPSYLDYS